MKTLLAIVLMVVSFPVLGHATSYSHGTNAADQALAIAWVAVAVSDAFDSVDVGLVIVPQENYVVSVDITGVTTEKRGELATALVSIGGNLTIDFDGDRLNVGFGASN